MIYPSFTAGGVAPAPIATNPMMINVPTVVPGQDVQGVPATQGIIGVADIFNLEVSTCGATADETVVLFDSHGALGLNQNTVSGANVVITGLTNNYQYMLNYIAHYSPFVDVIKMTVAKCAPTTTLTNSGSNCCCGDSNISQQFYRPLKVYTTHLGADPNNVLTIHPSKGIHEGQFRNDIVTFAANFLLSGTDGICYKQIPNTIVNFTFYMKAMVGRKK